jgi:tRNA nucleotidyltransferase/poly(A) polymerase
MPLAEREVDAYYVGGCVRDWLMGRCLKDIDLVVAAPTWRVGQAIADRMGAHLFWLREEEGVARVLKPGRGGLQIDLSPLSVPIEADLRSRDFTVNAMAVALSDGLRPTAPILDPTGGRADLARRRLRLVGPETLARDPLRLMRAVRLSEQLRFALETESEARIRAEAASLSRVSAERVRDELFQVLPAGWAPRALARMRTYALLPVFLPEAADLTDGVWRAVLERVHALHRLSRQISLPLRVRRRLREALAGGRAILSLLKWAVVLHAAPRADAAQESTRRLRLGAREGQLLAVLLREEERALGLLRSRCFTGREMHRFVRAAGGWATEALLYAASKAVPGSELPQSGAWSLELGAALEGAAAEEAALAAPLLSGGEVMDLLQIPAGPAVGRWLDALAEARADCTVTTPAEARTWILSRKGEPPDGSGSDRADAD